MMSTGVVDLQRGGAEALQQRLVVVGPALAEEEELRLDRRLQDLVRVGLVEELQRRLDQT